MDNSLDLHKNYSMLIYLAERGKIVNQLKTCSGLWDELLRNSYEREKFRFLRIELRRLRSALALLEPLLPDEGVGWLYQLKLHSNRLGNVREYDVVLQALAKYETYVLEAQSNNVEGTNQLLTELPSLKAMILEERELKATVFNTNARTGSILQEMASCLEVLEKPVGLCLEEEATANAFLQSSLQLWGLKLCNKLQNLEKLKTTSQLHKLRIKVKRFRFAYEVYMDTVADEELLLSLKELQNVLGSLHDGDRNIEILEEVVSKVEMNETLAKEVECFKAWREGKKQQHMEQTQLAVLKLLTVLQHNVVGAELL